MHIDWSAFTPWSALAGGALIGLAAAAMALLLGRVAGISGILGGLLRPAPGESRWRLAFLIGLLLAPWLARWAGEMPALKIEASSGLLIVAGLLVGVGTRYGAGCTSGHGVCGLSRLSGRSLVATLVFMAAGFVTVALMRHGGVL
ncbi:MAG TPA: YeeE/YedE family protein [Ideonella sp.]|uniref:YeeE/YedE family protein n=1 Tax=Ideonella sp. TaxID=1929293 RepID=UPI002C5551A6|nr:YeeE/YedE family protein [Ideonella sp.]HSI48860.1 YeeE/YedE family protein [Ideonella sp.]